MANRVSVVIPTFNAGPDFEELLLQLDAQSGDFELEVVVVDSGSTDGTTELAARHGAVLHSVSKASFDHGATRDLGISLSSGEYVALTVQDAVPLDERWLATMVENLREDMRVAAVYGRHVPRSEAAPLTRALVGNLAVAGSERREQEIQDPDIYSGLPPAQRRRVAAFDNVSSCVRRSVWEEFPFGVADFAEDLRWGKKVVEAGYTIVYEPRSVVVHSHERGALYDLRRHYVDQLVLDELFGARMVPSLPRLIFGIPYSARHVYRLLRREEPAPEKRPKHLLDAATYALASQLGAYLGCKIPSLSRPSPKLHAKLHRILGKGV
ncbi:MAG: Rhamnosyltransferase [uncultured Rubrobacteraceae bacterium]|uniref:Rhamnosyltransferase n=1 Tax=uncultured Rubrobacteraceae bacterium TaxID=349277 RepID=A0A6J4R0G9_9ACTN|nr:MAG: Rhamnosyltransferase [uncultured Rubrobacteraceae bacterium]